MSIEIIGLGKRKITKNGGPYEDKVLRCGIKPRDDVKYMEWIWGLISGIPNRKGKKIWEGGWREYIPHCWR